VEHEVVELLDLAREPEVGRVLVHHVAPPGRERHRVGVDALGQDRLHPDRVAEPGREVDHDDRVRGQEGAEVVELVDDDRELLVDGDRDAQPGHGQLLVARCRWLLS
jgi:hypothetical protein